MHKSELKWEYTKGSGPGGQHKNKVETCVKLTHLPTGITVTIDGRSRSQNKKEALKILEKRIKEDKDSRLAEKKKAARDAKIKDKKYIRTYDFKKQKVIDHRSGIKADLKKVLRDGQLDLLKE